MIRTQIQFTETQIEALRRLAGSSGRSIAQIARDALDAYLEQLSGVGQDAKIERAMKVVGQFASGVHDISANHDDYLPAAFHG